MNEIARCPNPECDPAEYTDEDDFGVFYHTHYKEWHVSCICGYQGPDAPTSEKAVSLHNLICTHPHKVGLCVDCDDSGPDMALTDDQIKHMVNRFLGWRLPENFNPDAGISFKKTFNDHFPVPMKHEPIGTNLFDAIQADAMVRYMVEGMPAAPQVWQQGAEEIREAVRNGMERYRKTDAQHSMDNCSLEDAIVEAILSRHQEGKA